MTMMTTTMLMSFTPMRGIRMHSFPRAFPRAGRLHSSTTTVGRRCVVDFTTFTTPTIPPTVAVTSATSASTAAISHKLSRNLSDHVLVLSRRRHHVPAVCTMVTSAKWKHYNSKINYQGLSDFAIMVRQRANISSVNLKIETCSKNDHHNNQQSNDLKNFCSCLVLASTVIAYLLWEGQNNTRVHAKHVSKPLNYEPGIAVKGLPTYTMKDVNEHSNSDTGIWVTYKNGVYDITKFIKWHPGGDKIKLAAGGGLEPFWDLYGVHKTKEVFEMLEEMRIGNIFDTGVVKKTKDAYEHDPCRHVALRVNSEKPFNAEPPPELLIDSFITPNALHFVRNHLPVPVVDSAKVDSYSLEICEKGGSLKSLTMSELKKMPAHTITVTLQCAGNRRKEMSNVKNVKGLSWDCGSVGTATWTGVKLVDVLHKMGYKEKYLAGKKVQFEGLDVDPTGVPYGASVPVEKAFDERQDILIAYQMNGEPIPADHGFPLRVIVPGVVGARNVKWLKKIVLSGEDSHSHWQRNDYKVFNPSIDFSTSDYNTVEPILELPVQSVICDPLPDSTLDADDGYVTVRGYAYSGGGNGIIRVDLSVDGGETWVNPTLEKHDQKPYRAWAWTLWEATVPIPAKHKGKLKLVCKAVDSSHNVQPDNVQGIWNLRGFLNTSWHRVTVNMK